MKTSFKEIIRSSPLVLVDFSAEWCGPCKALAPILKQLKDEVGEKVKVIKIDVDKNPALASNYNVMGVPTLILFKEGAQVWRQSGVQPKNVLTDLIQAHS
jgi:thioredoxin 1